MESEQYVSPVLAIVSISTVFVVLIAIFVAEMPSAWRLRDAIDRHAQLVTMLVAVGATGSSLYYSEVVGFIPCEFCWYQRIVMYPLAILLLVGVLSRRRLDTRFIVALAAIGLPLSIYHYQLQLFPEQGKVCNGIISCSDHNVDQFGFVSIPFMAGAGFLSILLLQLAEWRVRWLNQHVYGEEPEVQADSRPGAVTRAKGESVRNGAAGLRRSGGGRA